jgi:hypothetical protein
VTTPSTAVANYNQAWPAWGVWQSQLSQIQFCLTGLRPWGGGGQGSHGGGHGLPPAGALWESLHEFPLCPSFMRVRQFGLFLIDLLSDLLTSNLQVSEPHRLSAVGKVRNYHLD